MYITHLIRTDLINMYIFVTFQEQNNYKKVNIHILILII